MRAAVMQAKSFIGVPASSRIGRRCPSEAVTSMTHFEIFGLPQRFAVDLRLLAERYRALQALTLPDPDASTMAPDPDAEAPVRAAKQINDAYRTLKDPLLRARYLLSLHTGLPAHDERDAQDGTWLMDQIELQETMAEAQGRPNRRASAATVLTSLTEQSAALEKALEGLFAEPSPENLMSVREIIRKRRFLDRCRRDVEGLAD